MEQTYPEQCQRPFGPDDSCDCNPDFSVICSFISLFGDKIDIELNIERLKDSLESQESLDDDLVELHVKLLKKLRRYFVRDQWEKALMRFAYEYSYEDGREIEFLGYLKTKPSLKLQLLRRLLDAQFECDQKFKAAVNLHEACDLRNQPVGRDIKGNTYWHCADRQGNFRIFSEEPLNYKIWKLVSKTPDELKEFIDELDNIKHDKVKGEPHKEPYNPFPEIFPDYFVKSSITKENEEEDKKTSNKARKKGRHRGRLGKSSPLTVLQEVDEVDNQKTKVETKPSNHQAVCDSHQAPNNLDQPQLYNENGSVESQVKQTLESLINRVVTSFDFFFRWNSGNHDSNKKEDVKDEALTNGKKRNTKRAKKVDHVELPRRSSSRIQQLQQKKITEYIETTKKVPEAKFDSQAKRSDSRVENKPSNGVCSKANKRPKKTGQRWRSKGRKKLSWDKDDSDLSRTSSLTDSNDESFVEEIHNALNPEPNNDDDEFACEEEETNDAPVILKRARTARPTIDTEENGDLINGSIVEEDKPCGRCDKSNDPELILLCDMCDDGYHTTCCTPPLMFVPDGDWFCSPCEHKMLTTKLREILASLNELVSLKEREQQKKQKLRQKTVKKVQPVAEYKEDEIFMDTESEQEVPDSDESFQAPSKSDSEEEEDEVDEEYDVTEIETETDSSLDEIVAFQTSRPKRKRTIKKIEYESELDISNSDESFHASSESIEGEEDVTEIETETDSSIDEIAFNFPRSKSNRNRKRVEYDESDESDF